MDLRLWCAGASGSPDICVSQCGCGYCDGIGSDGACIGIPDFNLCRPVNLESFTGNCTAYVAPRPDTLAVNYELLFLGLLLVVCILVGLLVMCAKLYYVGKHEIYHASIARSSFILDESDESGEGTSSSSV